MEVKKVNEKMTEVRIFHQDVTMPWSSYKKGVAVLDVRTCGKNENNDGWLSFWLDNDCGRSRFTSITLTAEEAKKLRDVLNDTVWD